MSKIRVSVVIPCYYSEKMIPDVVRMTREELVSGGYDYEFVLVNDGSTDGTFAAISELAAEDPQVVGVDCAKNLGQHSAIMAGLQRVSGDFILLMDDDMQTHPSQCLLLLDALRDDDACDVVFGKWPAQKQNWWRTAGSNFTVWSMRVLTKRPKDLYMSNFFVMRRFVAEEMKRYTGPFVYVQGLVFRATSRMKNVEVKHFARAMGRSGYSLKALLRLWSSVLGFSLTPLRWSAWIGGILGVAGLVSAIVVVINKFLHPETALGWSSTIAILLVCSGLILLFLGLIGEYLGRLLLTANQSPQYVVRTVIDGRALSKSDKGSC